MVNILVVDDDPSTRVLLKKVLADELGYELSFAPDGEAALVRLARTRPDLVITDLLMPNVDGMKLIAELRTRSPQTPVIAISGKAAEHLGRATAAGAVAGLSKPLKKDELLDAIQKALEGPEPLEWGD